MKGGRIPQDIIDAVLKHHDIVDVVGKYVHLSKAGKYMKGLCPFHSEKTPSFTVTPEKQIFHCYGCHAGGSVIQFTMQVEGLNFFEAVRQLAEEANISLGETDLTPEQTEQQRERQSIYSAHEFAAKLYNYILNNTSEGKEAKQYLQARGFSDQLIEQFQIGYAPARWDTLALRLEKREFSLFLMEKGGLISARQDGSGYVDRFRERIMFPIHDPKGRVIAFAARTLGSNQPKYLNSPETALFHKSRTLYNFHQARQHIRKTRQAVLFEGYVDVIKAWEAGVNVAVATMGTSLTEEHAILLRRNADEIILCYDGDDAGQTAAAKSIPILEQAGMRVKIAKIPHKMDPDEYITVNGANAFLDQIIGAPLTSQKFKLLFLRKNYNLQDEDGLLRYIRAATRFIGGFSSPAEREHYIRELAQEFPSFSIDVLKQEMFIAREQLEKMRPNGDNQSNPWNNGRNDGDHTSQTPVMLPAYHQAERKLLAAMLVDAEVTAYVRERLGERFHVDTHASLAAYIYAYYAEGNEPDAGKFIAFLQNEELESVASAIVMSDAARGVNAQAIDDYIREIAKVPKMLQIEKLKEEMVQAQRRKDFAAAARIGTEIITLEKQMKTGG
jgi:DNA primase